MNKLFNALILASLTAHLGATSSARADDCNPSSGDSSCFSFSKGIRINGSVVWGGTLKLNGTEFSAVGPHPTTTPEHLAADLGYSLVVRSSGQDAGVVYLYDSNAQTEIMDIGRISPAGIPQLAANGKTYANGTWRFIPSANVSFVTQPAFTTDYWTCVGGVTNGSWMSMQAQMTRVEMDGENGTSQFLESRQYNQGVGKGTPPAGQKCGN